MARPKSTKPIKEKIQSVRLTKEDYVKIKKLYGSIQKYLDIMIKTLPIVILIACKQAEVAPREEALDVNSTNKTAAPIIRERIYAISRSQNELGFDIDADCNESRCVIEGKIYNYTAYKKVDLFNFVESHSVFNVRGTVNYDQVSGRYEGQLVSEDRFTNRDLYGMTFTVNFDSETKTLRLQAPREGSMGTSTCISNSSTVLKEEFDEFIQTTTQTFWTSYFYSNSNYTPWSSCE
jgi:hypothetical protein